MNTQVTVEEMDGNLVTVNKDGKIVIRESNGQIAFTGSRNKKRFFRNEQKAAAKRDWAYDLMAEAEEWSKR